MVKEASLPTETYDYPWELVVEAYLNRYPTHERIPVMLGSEVLERVTQADGVEVIKRLVILDVEAPGWVKRSLKQYDFRFLQTTTINRKERSLVMTSVNQTYEEKVDIHERAEYRANPDNPGQTTKAVHASMKLPRFPLSGLCEKLMIKSYTKNTAKGRELDLAFIQDVLDGGWEDRGGVQASPFHHVPSIEGDDITAGQAPTMSEDTTTAGRASVASTESVHVFTTPPSSARRVPAPSLPLSDPAGSVGSASPPRGATASSTAAQDTLMTPQPLARRTASPHSALRRRGGPARAGMGGDLTGSGGQVPDEALAPMRRTPVSTGLLGNLKTESILVVLNIAALLLTAVSFVRPSFVLPTTVCLVACTLTWLYRRGTDPTRSQMYAPDPGAMGAWDANRMSRGRASSDVMVPQIDDEDIDKVLTEIQPPATPAIRPTHRAAMARRTGGMSGNEPDLGTSQTSDGPDGMAAGVGDGMSESDSSQARASISRHGSPESPERAHSAASPTRRAATATSTAAQDSEPEEDDIAAALDLDTDSDSTFVDVGDAQTSPRVVVKWKVDVPASVAHSDPVNGVWFIINVTELATGKTWAVSRRYAEFVALDQAIRAAVSNQKWALVTLPLLPPKSLSNRNLAKRDLRREGLGVYLHHLTRNEYVQDNPNLTTLIHPRRPSDPYLTVPIETGTPAKIAKKHAPVNAVFRVMRGLQRALWRDEWACVLPTGLRFVDCQDPRTSVLDIPLDEVIDIVPVERPLWPGPGVTCIRTRRLRVFIAAENAVLEDLSAAMKTAARDYTAHHPHGSAPGPRSGKVGAVPSHSKDGSSIVLNRQTLALDSPVQDAEKLSAALLQRLLRIGNAEHGPGFTADLASSPGFASFAFAVSDLHTVTLHGMSEDSRIAFFLNVYHTLLLHALVDIGPPSSVMQRKGFYTNICYEIAGRLYSLADIEHGILRATSAKPAFRFQSLLVPSMKNSDSRSRHALREAEPRVSFALNVGCVSSPDLIFIYSSDNLDRQLDAAAKVFCAASITIEGHRARVTLPRILEWYAADFGGNKAAVLRRLAKWLPNAERQLLLSMVYVADASNIKISYRDFVWQFRTIFHQGDADAIVQITDHSQPIARDVEADSG